MATYMSMNTQGIASYYFNRGNGMGMHLDHVEGCCAQGPFNSMGGEQYVDTHENEDAEEDVDEPIEDVPDDENKIEDEVKEDENEDDEGEAEVEGDDGNEAEVEGDDGGEGEDEDEDEEPVVPSSFRMKQAPNKKTMKSFAARNYKDNNMKRPMSFSQMW
jgi:hypothetical protein